MNLMLMGSDFRRSPDTAAAHVLPLATAVRSFVRTISGDLTIDSQDVQFPARLGCMIVKFSVLSIKYSKLTL